MPARIAGIKNAGQRCAHCDPRPQARRATPGTVSGAATLAAGLTSGLTIAAERSRKNPLGEQQPARIDRRRGDNAPGPIRPEGT